MVVNNFLHLYLNKSPVPQDLSKILRLYGFKFLRRDPKSDPHEPEGYHWIWYNPPLSDKGFNLVFYHRLFSDDKFYGKFNSFAMLSADKNSSDMDVNAIDICSHFLLNLYGGQIYNPEGKTLTSYLCGLESSKHKNSIVVL